MIKEYIRDAYPFWIREDAFTEGTITQKYDEVRWFTFDDISETITNTAKELLVTTSTENWIGEWEDFLNISGEGRTLEERRWLLLSILTWWQTTFDLMKAITYLVVWWDVNSVTFVEYWTTGGTWDDVFKYEILINDNLLSLTYDVVALRNILEWVQPAHCTLLITITNDLIDSVWVTETLEGHLLSSMVWDTDTWSDENDITTWSLWW